jgi:hypothetical protein
MKTKKTKKNLARWGAIGGTVTSRAKSKAAKLNGKKGGRPKGSKNKPKGKAGK